MSYRKSGQHRAVFADGSRKDFSSFIEADDHLKDDCDCKGVIEDNGVRVYFKNGVPRDASKYTSYYATLMPIKE